MNVLNYLFCNYSYAMDYFKDYEFDEVDTLYRGPFNYTVAVFLNLTQIVLLFICIISFIILIKNIVHNHKMINITNEGRTEKMKDEVLPVFLALACFFLPYLFVNMVFGIICYIMILVFLSIAIKNSNHNKKIKNTYPKIEKASVTKPFAILMLLLFINLILEIPKNFTKPIIYIYPKEKTKVKIKVKNKEKLTCTYPKYEDGWEVEANPNGDLVDLKTNRKLYALYWEGIGKPKYNLKEGFIVEGNNVAKFLEEKLELLGLNEREAEEFIVYWLPKLECNKYNYIRFSLTEEVNEYMPLEITPKPDTLIRILIQYKPLAFKINVNEQILPKQERKGYTIVEWGGTKI